MKFLVAAQLPPALAKLLQAQGHEAIHVYELDLASTDDSAIWEQATRSGAVILTKDEDFMVRALFSKTRAPVVLIRIGYCSNQALARWFRPLVPELSARLQAGEMLIEFA